MTLRSLYNDDEDDDDESCVMMTVVGLLHDNGHYRRHKGQRTPLEAFIGSFLLTLSCSSVTKISPNPIKKYSLKSGGFTWIQRQCKQVNS